MSRKKGPVGQPTMASEGKLHTKLLEDHLWAHVLWSNMKIYEGYAKKINCPAYTSQQFAPLIKIIIFHFLWLYDLDLENGPCITLFVLQVCVSESVAFQTNVLLISSFMKSSGFCFWLPSKGSPQLSNHVTACLRSPLKVLRPWSTR